MKSKKAAVSMPYIVAAVLGVLIIGIIGYWFFTSTGIFGGAIIETACKAKLVTCCANDKSTTVDSCFDTNNECRNTIAGSTCESVGISVTGSGGAKTTGSADCSCYESMDFSNCPDANEPWVLRTLPGETVQQCTHKCLVIPKNTC